MRLWHYEIVKNNLLPNSQAVAEWRELNSIFRKQDNHILINYIYKYDKSTLKNYTRLVMLDLWDRDYNIRDYKNADNYFEEKVFAETRNKEKYCKNLFKEHNKDYLLTCFMNLREKYKCGQKDFTDERYNKLRDYIYKRYNGKDGKITIDLYSENFQED